MKTGWERRQPYILVDRAKVADLLAPVFPGREAGACELVTAGLVNSNYRVEVGGEPVLLRIYGRDPAACAKEAALARRFAGILPIPEALHADSSGRLIPQPYAVHRWVEGVRADDVASSGEVGVVADRCGALLAVLHAQEFARAGFLDGRLELVDPGPLTSTFYRAWMREWVLETAAADVLGPARTAEVLEWADGRAPLLDALDGQNSLVHSDFNGSNILLRQGPGGWEIAALLDWEFAFSGTSLFDVANMLRHYVCFGAGFADPFIAAFEAGGGRLPPAWRETAHALDMMSMIGFLSHPDCGDTMRRDVLDLVAGYLAS